jgi:hypothetical protein
MEECGFTVTRNPSEMGKLLKACSNAAPADAPAPPRLRPCSFRPTGAAAPFVFDGYTGFPTPPGAKTAMDTSGSPFWPDHHDRHPAGWRQRGGHRAGLPQAAARCAPRASVWGTAGAIVLRVVLIFFA